MIRKKILIIGGAGYLGQHIVQRFSSESKYIITIGDVIEPAAPSSAAFVELDICNKSGLAAIIEENDIIINCAGQITHPINNCFNINTLGVANIVDCVRQSDRKLFHISTVAVYGTCDFADENSDLNPESPYASFKAFAEFQVQSLPLYNSSILRLANLYGESQVKGLFAYLKRAYYSDKKLDFNNDGNLIRYFLHISDCAESIFLAVDKNLTGIYNVTANDKYSLKEIIQKLETLKSVSFETTFEPTPPIENIKQISFNKFTKSTGFEPEHTICSFINTSFI